MVMKVKELKIGSYAELKTKKGDFRCTILESPTSEIILVKLDSGYNIGVKEEDILDVKIIKKNEDIKEKENKEAKQKKSSKELPNIVLIATGGTISSRLDTKTGAVTPLTNPEELFVIYPELLNIVNVSKVEIPFMKASENMESDDWTKLAEIVEKYLNDKNIDGIILTHGTDFLAYTGAALSFALKNLNKPIVLTYSQRSSDRASSDARLNLICAARAAASEIAEVMLVGHANSSDDYCYALLGSKVRKMHTSRRDTFRPINTEPLAKVFPDKIQILGEYRAKDKSKKVELIGKFSDKVALVKFYPGQDPEILEYYLKNGYKGIVVEMSGLGHVLTRGKNNWLPKLRKVIREGLVVCGAAQTLYGKLDPFVYSVQREIQDTGVIFLRDILPETALVKMSWCFGNFKDKNKVVEKMLENVTKEYNFKLSEEQFLN